MRLLYLLLELGCGSVEEQSIPFQHLREANPTMPISSSPWRRQRGLGHIHLWEGLTVFDVKPFCPPTMD
jgi:hypothetical protein